MQHISFIPLSLIHFDYYFHLFSCFSNIYHPTKYMNYSHIWRSIKGFDWNIWIYLTHFLLLLVFLLIPLHSCPTTFQFNSHSEYLLLPLGLCSNGSLNVSFFFIFTFTFPHTDTAIHKTIQVWYSYSWSCALVLQNGADERWFMLSVSH